MKFKTISYIATAILAVFLIYGNYRWYFARPQQIVVKNEYRTYNVTGDNCTVNEAPKKVDKQRRFFTGLYGNRSEIGVTAGWLW